MMLPRVVRQIERDVTKRIRRQCRHPDNYFFTIPQVSKYTVQSIVNARFRTATEERTAQWPPCRALHGGTRGWASLLH